MTPLTGYALILRVKTDAYIALGSNLEDRQMNLCQAIDAIANLPQSEITGLSRFYETSPVGNIDQPAFLNAVLRLSTEIVPHDLLFELQHIESTIFGRERSIHWGPRKIDLDLLLYGNQIIQSSDLIVPHPRMAERRFVLQPLNDIAPDLVHQAFGKSISQLLAELVSEETVIPI